MSTSGGLVPRGVPGQCKAESGCPGLTMAFLSDHSTSWLPLLCRSPLSVGQVPDGAAKHGHSHVVGALHWKGWAHQALWPMSALGLGAAQTGAGPWGWA